VKAAILHDRVDAGARPDESDVLVQAVAVSEALSQLGFEPTVIEFGLDLSGVMAGLRQFEPSLVFNLVESVGGHANLIHLAPALLENLAIPFTGAGMDAMFATSNKLMAKRIMQQNDILTPDWIANGTSSKRGFPDPTTTWILKSVWEHASVGLNDGSLVRTTSFEDLTRRLERTQERLAGACFAEAYIDGREFNLSLLEGSNGPEVIAAAEILFVDFGEGKPHIVGYPAKWDVDSFEYQHTLRTFESPSCDSELISELHRIALACWEVFGLRGYARVDFRVDQSERPWVLEVNANPCLSPDSRYYAALLYAGIDFSEAIGRIVNASQLQAVPSSPTA